MFDKILNDYLKECDEMEQEILTSLSEYEIINIVEMGFNAGNIYSCCKGKRKSTGGYIFKYHKKE